MSQALFHDLLQALEQEIGVAIPTDDQTGALLRVNDQFEVYLTQRPNHDELALFSTVKTFSDHELAYGLAQLMAGGEAAQSGAVIPTYLKTGRQAALRSRLRTTGLTYEHFRTWLIRFFDALAAWQSRLAVPTVPEDCNDNLFLIAHALAC